MCRSLFKCLNDVNRQIPEPIGIAPHEGVAADVHPAHDGVSVTD